MVLPSVQHWFDNQCEEFRPDASNCKETSSPFVAALDSFYGTGITLKCYYQKLYAGDYTNSNYFSDLFNDIMTYFFTYRMLSAAVVVMVLTVICTFLRSKFVKSVFEPFARYLGVLDQNVVKFGEAAWRTTVYAFMWSSAVYVAFYRGYDYFQQPLKLWRDYAQPPPWDLCCLYAIEASWYVHSVYATIYIDSWRKDSIVMLAHHFVALFLIIPSFAVGFLKIGAIIFVLDDIGDVLLEVSKCLGYCRQRKSGFSPFIEFIAIIIAVIFTVQWIPFRLQWHLTKVVRSGTLGVALSAIPFPIPFQLYFIVLLYILYFFYCYWFAFIVLFIVRLVRAKQGEAEDPREVITKNVNVNGEDHRKIE